MRLHFGGSNTLSVELREKLRELRETIHFVTILCSEKDNGGSRAFNVSSFQATGNESLNIPPAKMICLEDLEKTVLGLVKKSLD